MLLVITLYACTKCVPRHSLSVYGQLNFVDLHKSASKTILNYREESYYFHQLLSKSNGPSVKQCCWFQRNEKLLCCLLWGYHLLIMTSNKSWKFHFPRQMCSLPCKTTVELHKKMWCKLKVFQCISKVQNRLNIQECYIHVRLPVYIKVNLLFVSIHPCHTNIFLVLFVEKSENIFFCIASCVRKIMCRIDQLPPSLFRQDEEGVWSCNIFQWVKRTKSRYK